MPFKHYLLWEYPFANSDEWWGSGYNATAGAKDYREMYDLTCYLLTNYNNSGKTFYLGHWEGDGYLEVNEMDHQLPSLRHTFPDMIGWLNNRAQKAVDDAKAATAHTNVFVYNYAECNRVRDAMNGNGTNNNQRVINYVVCPVCDEPRLFVLFLLRFAEPEFFQPLHDAQLHAGPHPHQQGGSRARGADVGQRIWHWGYDVACGAI